MATSSLNMVLSRLPVNSEGISLKGITVLKLRNAFALVLCSAVIRFSFSARWDWQRSCETNRVSKAYYLFRTDEEGTIVTVQKVTGLDQVKERLAKLPVLKRSQLLIYDPLAAKFVEPFKNLLKSASLRTSSRPRKCL